MSSGGNSDDRIVSITFDNSRFQARVEETIASVKALDQQLKMTNGTQGLSDISKAASKVDFAPIAQGIEGISAKFAAMATIGITALSNLTNKAVDAGIAMTKSLTIGSAQSGFGEYETNMGSIQTILANTAPSNTVTHMKPMVLLRLPATRAWWAMVNVTPEVSSSAVLIVA